LRGSESIWKYRFKGVFLNTGKKGEVAKQEHFV